VRGLFRARGAREVMNETNETNETNEITHQPRI
jgi:hypothetical protein